MNDDIERARANLNISGYTHPEDTSRNSKYKVYSETSDDVYLSESIDTYATFTLENTGVQKSDICPKCEKKASYACGCPKKEMMCAGGHMWYYENNGKLKIGDPHA